MILSHRASFPVFEINSLQALGDNYRSECGALVRSAFCKFAIANRESHKFIESHPAYSDVPLSI